MPARLTAAGADRYANAGTYNHETTQRILEAARNLQALGNANANANGQQGIEAARVMADPATNPPAFFGADRTAKACPGTVCGRPCVFADGHPGNHFAGPDEKPPTTIGRSAEFIKTLENAKPINPERAEVAFLKHRLDHETQRGNKLADKCGDLTNELTNERARCRELERKIERIEGRNTNKWKA